MIYHPRKADGNQSEIVKAMKAAGWSVADTHTLGEGFLDLVCDFRGFTCLVEVKDPKQPKHRHELTKAQKDFVATWSGPYYIVFTIADALAIRRPL